MAHGPQLYDEAVRVPLLMRWPGVVPAEIRPAAPVSLLDLHPTIFDLLGLANADPEVQRRSLVPALRPGAEMPGPTLVPLYRGPGLRQQVNGSGGGDELYGIRSGRWKYLTGGNAAAELYDLESDPEERRNRISDDPERARRMQADLDALLAEDPAPAIPQTTLTADERAALETLGYLQSSANDSIQTARP